MSSTVSKSNKSLVTSTIIGLFVLLLILAVEFDFTTSVLTLSAAVVVICSVWWLSRLNSRITSMNELIEKIENDRHSSVTMIQDKPDQSRDGLSGMEMLSSKIKLTDNMDYTQETAYRKYSYYLKDAFPTGQDLTSRMLKMLTKLIIVVTCISFVVAGLAEYFFVPVFGFLFTALFGTGCYLAISFPDTERKMNRLFNDMAKIISRDQIFSRPNQQE